jgi:CheY-like chemotaxis protein
MAELPPVETAADVDLSFKVFHELMARKVADILLVSSPYDAFIMEEEGRLAERIILEYRGLNLSRPPRLTWVSTAGEALDALAEKKFDMVITMPRLNDMDAYALGRAAKARQPDLPVFMLTHSAAQLRGQAADIDTPGIDRHFVWLGNSDLLLALVKSVEDCWNIDADTRRALVRVILLVEDSPLYLSSLLPMLYKEIVMQTQRVMEESFNEEHRLFRMRARPKIVTASTYEDAEALWQRFKPYLLCILCDVRFPRQGKEDPRAGIDLLRRIHAQHPDLPLLNLSNEPRHQAAAEALGAVFVNKNSPNLLGEIRNFFVHYCGFGPFVFRNAEGLEIGRVENLRQMERLLPSIPDEVVRTHALRNDFSSWLMARAEIQLATRLRPVLVEDFTSIAELKQYLVDCIRQRRRGQRRGVISEPGPSGYDPDADLVKVGKGSLGGKARGLAFIFSRLRRFLPDLQKRYGQMSIGVPPAMVIATDGFDAFMAENELRDAVDGRWTDAQIAARFDTARLPAWVAQALGAFARQVRGPLAVRSSSLLEDARFQPYAGIYRTIMLPNADSDIGRRQRRLGQAVRQVYASTFMSIPRSYTRGTMHRIEDEKMAVILQPLVGRRHGNVFYPALAGVARSVNYYPVGPMTAEGGIAAIALGLGKTVVEGGKAVRFAPLHPRHLPQFSTVDDVLRHCQREFFALRMDTCPEGVLSDEATLARLEVETATDHPPVAYLSSCYVPADHRIRDTWPCPEGYPILTFSRILKYGAFPLPALINDVLEIGREGMGGPVEIEFAVNLPDRDHPGAEFWLLQIRPMGAAGPLLLDVHISVADLRRAFCHSEQALGNGVISNIADIVYVRPDTFDPARTVDIAAEIGHINDRLTAENRPYLLIGPGRWGTADRWLGIPVDWRQISGVAAIVETSLETLKADPSQGSHFFHNITSLGIGYVTVADDERGFIDWGRLERMPAFAETRFLRHLRLDRPMTIKIDGKTSRAVMLAE